MILDRAKRVTPSALIQPRQSSTALLRLAHSAPGDGAGGVAAFPRRPIAFLWHYIRRRPFLHFGALASVLLAASCACAAQYGLKMIVDVPSTSTTYLPNGSNPEPGSSPAEHRSGVGRRYDRRGEESPRREISYSARDYSAAETSQTSLQLRSDRRCRHRPDRA